MSLSIKLDIFKQTGMINDEDHTKLHEIIDLLEKELHITLEEDNAGMLITHAACMMRRIHINEQLNDLNDEIYEEIKKHKSYDEAKLILEKITNIIVIPEYEVKYLMMHLCNIMNR